MGRRPGHPLVAEPVPSTTIRRGRPIDNPAGRRSDRPPGRRGRPRLHRPARDPVRRPTAIASTEVGNLVPPVPGARPLPPTGGAAVGATRATPRPAVAQPACRIFHRVRRLEVLCCVGVSGRQLTAGASSRAEATACSRVSARPAARAAARAAPPDVLLLDLRLPVLDGWAFARASRRRPPPRAPLAVMTAALDARRRRWPGGAQPRRGRRGPKDPAAGGAARAMPIPGGTWPLSCRTGAPPRTAWPWAITARRSTAAGGPGRSALGPVRTAPHARDPWAHGRTPGPRRRGLSSLPNHQES
jgi:CheY-like chemotaxis protein